MRESNAKGMGLYIHIPFCVSKCAYCDFLSFEGMGRDIHERYVRALVREMQYTRGHGGYCTASSETSPPLYDTVYIGGGTPTALPPPLLCAILQEVQQFNLAPNAEITLEMNPSTNQLASLASYACLGINRLSIGLQAWQDEFLRGLRRSHTSTEFIETMQAARAAGICNINVDLMFGLPWQSLWHWRESITQVLACKPTHISAYSLTPAEDTPLWDALEAGKIKLPSQTSDRAMYHEAIHMLSKAGYEHYELSNFAKPGYESKHNTNCWLREPYVGLGLGAHSFNGDRRWRNTMDMGRYLGVWGSPTSDMTQQSEGMAHPINTHEDVEILTQRDAMAEAMFLGLRMTKGIKLQDFYRNFGQQLTECFGHELKMLTAKGLITCTAENIALTPLGLDLANQVFEAFV